LDSAESNDRNGEEGSRFFFSNLSIMDIEKCFTCDIIKAERLLYLIKPRKDDTTVFLERK
jgi:hypothetical protein